MNRTVFTEESKEVIEPLQQANHETTFSARPWWILTGFSSLLFVLWILVEGYNWQGYPCFVWEAHLAVRAVYFLLLLGAVIGFCHQLMFVVIDPRRFTNLSIVLAFVVFTLLRIIIGSALPLLDDEAYHWLWPAHLDWAYYDHGGLLGWLTYPFRAYSDSVVSARMAPILLGTLTGVLTWLFARWITDDRTIANRALAGLMLLPVGLVGTTILFTDTPLAPIWIAASWLFLLAIRHQSLKYWLALGLVMGLGLNVKFLILGLAMMFFFYMLIDPQGRKSFQTRGPYLAALLAVVLSAPLIYWNAVNDWQTFYFNFVHRSSLLGFYPEGLLVFAYQQIVLVGPLFLVWAFILPAGWTLRIFREKQINACLLLLVGYVPFLFYSMLKLFRPVHTSSMNWTPPLFTVLVIIFAWSAARSRWSHLGLVATLRASGITTCIIVGGLIGQFFIGPDSIESALGSIVTEKRLRRYQKDFFGWYTVGKEMDMLHERFSADHPTFVISRTYMHASNLSLYMDRVPLVLSMGNDAGYGRCFDYWNEPEQHVGWDALVVVNHPISRKNKAILADAFESVRELPHEERAFQHPINQTYHVYFCRGAKRIPGAADIIGDPEPATAD